MHSSRKLASLHIHILSFAKSEKIGPQQFPPTEYEYNYKKNKQRHDTSFVGTEEGETGSIRGFLDSLHS
jgi:hypothetical protein